MIETILNNVKQRQYLNLALVILVIAIVIGLSYELISHNHPQPKNKLVNAESLSFSSPLQKIDPESVLLEKTQLQVAESQKKTDALLEHINEIEKEKQIQTQSAEKQENDYETLKQKIAEIESRLPHASGAENNENNPFATQKSAPSEAHIHDDELSLSAKQDHKSSHPLKNPATYVPAGTFVKAVLIGGADVSAAVNSQANPTPILLKIIADGTLPNQAHSHLKGCVATAAAIGDISSERGMIRLETLSCIHKNHSITDVPVEGTVFGPEGKNGVRGLPLWRESAFLQRAFAAGALSGLTNGIQQKYTTTAVSPLGSTQTVNNGDILKYGVASGTSSAMDKLANYEIQRAEQYHPVIQLSAGTFVDIVFLKGFFLDTFDSQDQKSDPENNSPPEISMQTLPLTPKEVERLKTHDTELRNLR
jgi:conjugal transfer pilus assembly protein TraB